MYSNSRMYQLKNANSYKQPLIKILIALLVAAIIVALAIWVNSSVDYPAFHCFSWMFFAYLLLWVFAYIEIQCIVIKAVYCHKRGRNGKPFAVIDVITMIDRRTSIHMVLESNNEFLTVGCGKYNYRNFQNLPGEAYKRKEYHYFIEDVKFYDYYEFRAALEKIVGTDEVLVLMINDKWQ